MYFILLIFAKNIKKSGFFFRISLYLFIRKNYLTEAAKYSRFIRAMFSKEIPFGHSTSHAPVLVQFPKPSASIASTMFLTRSAASIRPCGNKANCDTFAETNNIAEAFLHDATQAPHPIQVAASKALSASCLLTGMLFASCVFPEVFTDIYPPACWILSREVLSTTKSLITGKALARNGSI